MLHKINSVKAKIKAITQDDLNEAITAFWLDMAKVKQRSDHTVYNYLLDISSFLKATHISTLQQLQEVKATAVTKWLAQKNAKQQINTASSNRRRVSSIKMLYSFLQNDDFIETSNIAKIETPRKKMHLPKAVTEEELLEFLRAAENYESKDLWISARNKSIIMLLASVGLRISEALSITRQSISSSTEFIKILGKGKKERIVPLMDSVKKDIASYIALCPFTIAPSQKIFVNTKGNPLTARNLQDLFVNICNTCMSGVKITPHTLRHTCATLLLQNNQKNDSLRKIQKLLGHSSLSVTQIYTKITNKEIINKLNTINYN